MLLSYFISWVCHGIVIFNLYLAAICHCCGLYVRSSAKRQAMKRYICFAAIAAILLPSCNLLPTGDPITGDYTRIWKHERGTLFDTIAIRSDNAGTEDMTVVTYGTTRLVDSVLKVHRAKTYHGTYSPVLSKLTLNDPGLTCYFNKRTYTLTFGEASYKKIDGEHPIRN
jgi:hypothetical protein